jgi:prepilin-type N-terminal cleavage/methylation domain-containing protein
MTKMQKGFTLVELMIVVAIIGVLAAVAIPKFADMLEKSREGATKGNISAMASAVSNYYADQQGVYPQTLNSLTFSISGQAYPAYIPAYIETIPAVKATGKNTSNTNAGQGPGVGTLNASVYPGTHSSPAFVATSVGKGWKYNNTDGNLWVNSTQVDMAGKSYTMFGYE